jgi:hypothetical protein
MYKSILLYTVDTSRLGVHLVVVLPILCLMLQFYVRYGSFKLRLGDGFLENPRRNILGQPH